MNQREACEACHRELRGIIKSKSVVPRFRPVASLGDGRVFGHIATLRGPSESMLRLEERLVSAACRFGLVPDLVQLYFDKLLSQYAGSQATGRLLIPLAAGMVDALGASLAKMLERSLKQTCMPPARVMAIPPGILCGDEDRADGAAALAHSLLRLGVGLVAWIPDCPSMEELPGQTDAPEYAILGECQIEGLDGDSIHSTPLQARMRTVRERGRRILALGVNGLGELRAAQALGIDFVAGDFIGKPNVEPAKIFSAAASKAIRDACPAHASPTAESPHLLERLLVNTRPVSPETTAAAVFAMFENDPGLRAIAVVEHGYPLGLIARYDLVDKMARPFRLELYGNKPCTRFMDPAPLAMDIRLGLPELAELVAQADPRHLMTDFVMTDHGHYAGMGTLQDLVQEITTMQLEAARYANPLTQLPGNVPINQHLDNLLRACESFTVCYGDLDHFKPFNDVYGYASGDGVILLTARILMEVCEADHDFVGHIGGDDFVVVFRSADWEERCRDALRRFAAEIIGHFGQDDVERGGYVTENRKGEMEFHPLTSLSIGAVQVAPGVFRSHLAIAAVAAEVKKKAKAFKGNSLYVNQRAYPAPWHTIR